jgi:hypothetical protein
MQMTVKVQVEDESRVQGGKKSMQQDIEGEDDK